MEIGKFSSFFLNVPKERSLRVALVINIFDDLKSNDQRKSCEETNNQ